MGHVSTHVLDTAAGRPAAGVAITLRRLTADGPGELLARAVTNADGRTDGPLLEGAALTAGTYELLFQVGAYFARSGAAGGSGDGEPPFLDAVPVRFGVSDPDGRYHVPLLITPWSYATYRGS
ncbi:hydroxyisourate hydrolase [Methylobacterium persicinum]|uniref:5-hydroxyisourate hydrolase n=1 Tax=Methylobacterium persicinum TaxID=374426 RepID=A0ABU0HLA1_9HYPH|nr:hydroxyisourate hydrolase [Methylobacterium persicinum]MDQ0443103.1 5-hydroxyisourate hydrolase/2-oxo-4-hydroxy-4-carboxy-5-ureidoimidazoline decarboxylase [Methylobacterium persicinum]GJE38980.1 5-hydroxyisourate hydrolase [Methylobacterium persicinum]